MRFVCTHVMCINTSNWSLAIPSLSASLYWYHFPGFSVVVMLLFWYRCVIWWVRKMFVYITNGLTWWSARKITLITILEVPLNIETLLFLFGEQCKNYLCVLYPLKRRTWHLPKLSYKSWNDKVRVGIVHW